MTAMAPKPENLARLVLLIRGEKVLLDSDLADLYGVEARALNQAVARNRSRFPEDFMFQLTPQEWAAMRSQTVTSSGAKGSKSAQTAMSQAPVAASVPIANSLPCPATRFNVPASNERRCKLPESTSIIASSVPFSAAAIIS